MVGPSSASENFYGLKRRRRPLFSTERSDAAVGTGSLASESRLRPRETRPLDTVDQVGIPYIRAKARDYWEQLGGGADEGDLGGGPRRRDVERQSMIDRLRSTFKLLYPWADTAFELWMMSYNIGYLFDRTPFYRPWLKWMGVDIQRMGPEDYRQTTSNSPTKPPLQSNRNLLTILKSFLFRTPSLILDSLKILLPLSIFFVKFLEWWYSPTSPARALHSKADNGPLLPQPKVLKPHPNGILGSHPHEIYSRKQKTEGAGSEPQLKYGACPLCDGPLANPTALPSGYVFCYKCVFEEVEKHGRCPVTLLPMRTWMLRKVLV
ncbi:ubiquitin-protein ligase peroxin 12 [Tulasnella sp. 424]|nr:ubiquitin-protein ligase peroxin 12 [Tulasnella sp. 424]